MSEGTAENPPADSGRLGVLPMGTRVRVIQDSSWAGPWRQEFLGEICDLEDPVLLQHPMAQDGELVYWVEFDEPQYESGGDGPYRKAQIWGRYLRKTSAL